MHQSFKVLFASLLLCLYLTNNATAQTPESLPNTFFWRISGNGLQQPSYLYGTIHITEKRVFFFGDSLYKALESVEGYAGELDMDSLSTYLTNNLFKDSKSKLLKDILDKETFKKLSTKLSKKLNIPANKITVADIEKERNKAYRKSIKNGEMSGFMDAYLNNIAKKQGKWTGGIEDLNDQIGINDDETNLDPEFILQQSSESDQAFFDLLIKVYIAQDLQGINDLYNNYSTSFKTTYIDKRNIKMARRLDSLAHIRTMFFTMGVAHLPGENGVIELLKKRGFTVEPVFSSKKIAPEKYVYKPVQINWVTNYTKDSSFSFRTPGAANIVPMENIPIDMYMYVDLGTNSIYYSMGTGIAPSVGNNNDSILNGMVDGMAAKSGKTLERKKIIFKECDAIETLSYSKEDIYLRTVAFIKDRRAYLMLFGTKKKEDCYTKEVDYFINSIEILKTSTTPKNKVITDTNFLYTATVTGKELNNFQLPLGLEDDLQSWNLDIKAYVNDNFSNLFILAAKEAKPGYYISSDTALYNLVENQLLSKKGFKLLAKAFIDFKGHKALQLNVYNEKVKTLFRTIQIVKDNRVYSIIAGSMTEDSSQAISFINSFDFITPKPTNWSSNTTDYFSVWSPAAFTITDTVAKNNYISFDKNTTATYEVLREVINPYQYWTSDTAFLHEQIKSLKRDDDSLVYSKVSIQNNLITTDFEFITPLNYNSKKYHQIMHADTLFTICLITPSNHTKNENNNRFFNSFKINNPASTSCSIFTDKAEKLIVDLQSSDTTLQQTATENFYKVDFQKKHLPSLHKMLFKKYSAINNWYLTPSSYAESALTNLEDSSTVELLKKNYQLPDSTYSIDRAQMVAMLLSMNSNAWAKETAEQILLTNPPMGGSIEDLAYKIGNDSGKNSAFIMKLMPLSKDSLWAFTLSRTASVSLDSGYLTQQQLLPYENNFIKETNRRIERLQSIDSFNYDIQYYWLLQLLKSYNTIASNNTLQHTLLNKHLEIVNDATFCLLSNNQPVAASVLQKLAADDMYRLSIYEALKKYNKAAQFPKQFATQKYFARAYLKTMDEDDVSVDSLKFIKEKIYTLNGKKLKFYLYKVTFQGENVNYLGIAGGFSLNAGKFDVEEYASGIAFDAELDEINLDELFINFIKQYEKDTEAEKEIADTVE